MGELEFKDFTICYQNENGEMKPFTSWNLNKNGLSWTIASDEERIEALESLINNTDATLEFSSAVCSDDFTHLLETPEMHYEFSEELKEELKEISREESQKAIDEKTDFWCQAFLNFINGEENPFDPKLYQNTTDTIEAICKGLQKSKEVGISAAEAIEKFAESSKLFYDKEKEKKGENMGKEIVVVRFWNQDRTRLGDKEYYYYLKSECHSMAYAKNSTLYDGYGRFYITNDQNKVYDNPVTFMKFIPLEKATQELKERIKRTIIKVETDGTSVVKNLEEYHRVRDSERINVRDPKNIKYEKNKKDAVDALTYAYEYNKDIDILNLKNNNKKEKEQMNFNKIFPNAEIGKAKGVKMSVYGPAFHTYDEREIAFKDGEWIDVTGLTFDFCPAYVCPVKASEIAVGDFIKHLNCWCRVIGIDGVNITAENIAAHEVITILPVKSMFGFDFYSKLIIPFGDVTANIGDAFSNPFMTMILFGDDSNNFNDMLPFMFMNGSNFDMSNPMMMYFLMKNFKSDNSETNKDIMF